MRPCSGLFWPILALIFGLVRAQEECECNQRLLPPNDRLMLFCGDKLNKEISTNQKCNATQLYICSLKNSTAVPIGTCPQLDNDCNDSDRSSEYNYPQDVIIKQYFTGNHCLRNIRCTCRGIRFQRDQLYCGDQLQGNDCVANVIFRCRVIGNPVPVSICTDGCNQNKCTPKSTLEKSNAKTNTTDDEHEVEFVTFAPLVHLGNYP